MVPHDEALDDLTCLCLQPPLPGARFAWAVVLAGSVAALALVLTGFTTDATVTNNPESERADERLLAAFPPDPNVKFRSRRRALVRPDGRRRGVPDVRRGLASESRETGVVSNAQTYVDVDDGSLVSADRQATLIPVNITDADEAGDVIDVVERADADPEFAVTITGDTTLDFGFNELRARDLEEGELKSIAAFHHPAARLRHGRRGPGSVADGSRRDRHRPRAGSAAHPAVRAVDLHDEHAHGHGARARDRLRVVRHLRYREERGRRRSPDDAIVTTGGTASRAVLFSGSAFVIAMFGLLIVPSTIFRSLAAERSSSASPRSL